MQAPMMNLPGLTPSLDSPDVELFISAQNLPTFSGSNYFAKIEVCCDPAGHARSWTSLGCTEPVAGSPNPCFVRSVVLSYRFEALQKLRVHIFRANPGYVPQPSMHSHGMNMGMGMSPGMGMQPGMGMGGMMTGNVMMGGQPGMYGGGESYTAHGGGMGKKKKKKRRNQPHAADARHGTRMGTLECLLGDICGSTGGALRAPLVACGHFPNFGQPTLTLRAEEMLPDSDPSTGHSLALKFNVRATNLKNMDTVGATDGFFLLKRQPSPGMGMVATQGRMGSNDGWQVMFRSEVIPDCLSPAWSSYELPLHRLTRGNVASPIRLEVYDRDPDGDESVGFVVFSVQQLQSQPYLQLPLQCPGGGHYENRGVIHIEGEFKTYHSFLEYLVGGLEISLAVAIDFTGSNGNASNHSSLHHIQRGRLNDYEKAIHSVGEILSCYDADNMYPVLGFGARQRRGGNVSHCFSIGGRDEVHGVEGILQAYHSAVHSLHFSGPTNFRNVIQKIRKKARSDRQNLRCQKYHVLLIVTDGLISDLNETIEEVVKASKEPLSIIIVGVGSADFDSMDRLDFDGRLLKSRSGGRAKRDIVQFVPFPRFRSKPIECLARAVLEEVPRQVTRYFYREGIAPMARPNVFPETRIGMSGGSSGHGHHGHGHGGGGMSSTSVQFGQIMMGGQGDGMSMAPSSGMGMGGMVLGQDIGPSAPGMQPQQSMGGGMGMGMGMSGGGGGQAMMGTMMASAPSPDMDMMMGRGGMMDPTGSSAPPPMNPQMMMGGQPPKPKPMNPQMTGGMMEPGPMPTMGGGMGMGMGPMTGQPPMGGSGGMAPMGTMMSTGPVGPQGMPMGGMGMAPPMLGMPMGGGMGMAPPMGGGGMMMGGGMMGSNGSRVPLFQERMIDRAMRLNPMFGGGPGGGGGMGGMGGQQQQRWTSVRDMRNQYSQQQHGGYQ